MFLVAPVKRQLWYIRLQNVQRKALKPEYLDSGETKASHAVFYGVGFRHARVFN